MLLTAGYVALCGILLGITKSTDHPSARPKPKTKTKQGSIEVPLFFESSTGAGAGFLGPMMIMIMETNVPCPCHACHMTLSSDQSLEFTVHRLGQPHLLAVEETSDTSYLDDQLA